MESLDTQSSISDDDEFFEAVESQDEADSESGSNAENTKNIKRTDSDLNEDNIDNNTAMSKREGAKEPFGDLKLLVSGKPLIVPVTQVGF